MQEGGYVLEDNNNATVTDKSQNLNTEGEDIGGQSQAGQDHQAGDVEMQNEDQPRAATDTPQPLAHDSTPTPKPSEERPTGRITRCFTVLKLEKRSSKQVAGEANGDGLGKGESAGKKKVA